MNCTATDNGNVTNYKQSMHPNTKKQHRNMPPSNTYLDKKSKATAKPWFSRLL